MFDRLEDTLVRFEELLSMLSEPDVANDPKRFQKLMKEQADLAPIVDAYKQYKQAKQDVEDSLALLDEESDEGSDCVSLAVSVSNSAKIESSNASV